MRRLVTAALVAALALTGCSAKASNENKESTAGNDLSYDLSKVQKVDEIAALVPENIRQSGKLIVGASIDYAPAEFRADDLQTAIGYDMDMAKALGKVLGLETEISPAEFASLLPGMGTKYNVGISSFTVTKDRLANYNMVSYIQVGSSFAVKKGNPDGFNPDDVCGQSVGVQTGTSQELELKDISAKCVADGKKGVDILSYPVQSDVTTNVAGGKIIAYYADSTVAGYSAKLTNGQLEVIGGVRQSLPQGIVISKKDEQLTKAVQAAMQYLMDQGIWPEILKGWGVDEAALTKAELNPAVNG